MSSSGQYITGVVDGGYIYTCNNGIANNAVIQVGGYTSGSGVTGVAGSLYYDTTASALKVTNGSAWSFVGLAGTTALGATGLSNGATLTSDGYLQMAYSIGGSTTSSYPGLMPDSYSDIFSDLTIDLGAAGPTGNFGMNWVTTNTSIGTKNWYSVSQSSSGQYQTAVVYGGYIYISSDYGNTWTQKESSRNWYGVSLSSSGQYQTAVVYSGYIYISSDYGNTWTQTASSFGSIEWTGVSISASGQYQIACMYIFSFVSGTNGVFVISSDYGNTWTIVPNTNNRNWKGVSVSASGQYQAAVEANGVFLTSSDYGNTWTTVSLSLGWIAVCISASGQYQTVSANTPVTYISSDYGKTWTLVSALTLNTISMSASGQYQVGNRQNNYLYISSDYGKTWTSTASSRSWNGVSISASGQYITGVVSGDYIYTCRNSVAANNAVVQVGGYTSGSGVTGVVGSLYYDTTASALKISNGSAWSSVSLAGVTALGATGLTNGATLTSNGYLQLAYASPAAATGPTFGITATDGLMPGSYSDIFSDLTIDLGAAGPTGNFGMNWITTNTSIGTAGWSYISLSASGQYQTACVSAGVIYISSDYGNTWTSTNTSIGGKNWQGVSISASGQYQTACEASSGYIYISSDYGNTWIQDASITSTPQWSSVSLSASGQYQTAVTSNNYLYISSNYGKTWISKVNDTTRNWQDVSISSSGQYQTAVVSNSYIYISSDYGYTWTSTLSGSWTGVYVSASGQHQTALAFNNYIYTSADYGKTWTQDTSVGTTKSWKSVSLSASGQYQVATIDSGSLYISSNYGKTWTPTASSRSWRGISVSASGQYIAGVVNGGYIYTCKNGLANNAVIQVGGYTSGSGVTGVVGSLYYDTTLSALRVSNGSTWQTVVNGVTGVGLTATNGATVTTGGYLQLVSAGLTSPGIVTTTGQTFAGDKYFIGSIGVSGIIRAGNYPTASGPTFGTTGSLYYDTTLSALRVSNGSTWQTVVNGVTALGVTRLTNGVTLTSNGYLQLAYASAAAATGPTFGITASAGLMPGSYSDIFSTQTIDLGFAGPTGNFGNNWIFRSLSVPSSASPMVSMSSSGQYQTYCIMSNTYGYISSDYGNTWRDIYSNYSTGSLSGITISSNGKYVAMYGSKLVFSSDYGSTFTTFTLPNTPFTNSNGFAMSASGQYQSFVSFTRVIYVSSDYGKTWNTASADASINWYGISMSASGQYQTAFQFRSSGGKIHISSNYGTTWTSTNFTIACDGICVSASGQYQSAFSQGGYIYISYDYGQTWVQSPSSPSQNWYGICISASGQYQVAAVATNNYIWLSSDYGKTWTVSKSPVADYRSVCISASGQYITAGVFTGSIYTCYNSIGTRGVLQIGGYTSGSGVTGVTGSLYYDTTLSALRVTNGSTWSSLGISGVGNILGVTGLNSSSLTNGAIVTSNGYLQLGPANGTNPGLLAGTTLSATSLSTGSTLTSNGILRLGLADVTNPGLVTTTGQTFAGDKYFTGSIGVSGIIRAGNYPTASGPTFGTTGSLYYDTTLSALRVTNGSTWQTVVNGVTGVGLTATNGATVTTGGYLQLVSAGLTSPGIVTTTGQTFAGDKYFRGSLGVSGVIGVGNFAVAPTSGITGSLYYDTTRTAGATALLVSSGAGWTSVKSFVIEHPTNTEKLLVHGCLEGPEAGVYYRGESEITNNTKVTIELPHYVDKFATNLTVQVTPIYNGSVKTLSVSKVKDNKFTVYGENGEFFWTVFGKRLSLVVEPNKKDVLVKGDGPYKWI
jgi:hypothetical protein